ncbi:TetR/AcrR family transcriptional regulator [Pedobacter hiemivivus]|uniref:TetR/AcrR family transcriptional regulator n=1 Tax=Pedobacter hiemivivus TaxID=2530454 RepID=A0A4U1GL51_9SPHI|nr:TetR/AcrR family transcriptional regulator [Pedobacter hiemivivus]TCC98395.1 TetR/AcrR family transcriptional regulator [Pedobacter hiemivivus]TKC65117.1 TetR/AcrR family transcriptional regulator [Pedobacter hiemivivus]
MRARDINKVELVKQKAIELLVEVGFEGFTMNKLAKACRISVATLYIYYKDKDDLILNIGTEEVHRMSAIMLEDFDPESSFAEGLRQQWKNRAKCILENPLTAQMIEQLRSSTYQEKIFETFGEIFKEPLGKFMHNAIERGEIAAMPLETYWSVAFGPLYSLLRFHNEGKSLSGKPFVLTDEVLWSAFDLVLKGFKK